MVRLTDDTLLETPIDHLRQGDMNRNARLDDQRRRQIVDSRVAPPLLQRKSAEISHEIRITICSDSECSITDPGI